MSDSDDDLPPDLKKTVDDAVDSLRRENERKPARAGAALFAYVCDDRNQGDEIVCCVVPGLGVGPVPMVFANERVAKLMRFIAAGHATGIRKPVKLVKFTNREVLETLDP